MNTRMFVPAMVVLLSFCSGAVAQESATKPVPNRDPQTAVISTSDVDLFWRAYDGWKTDAKAAPDQLAAILDRDYVKKGSQGVQDFVPHRIISGEELAKTILKDQKYYDDVRANTEKMQGFIPEIRKGFERLKRIYPEAVFPPVYFVIGRRNSGGTDSENGLIIGAEMFADSGSRIHLDEVVCIVIHELIHYQQQTKGSDLTAQIMKEGAADFIAELITGNEIDENTKPYGDSHEQELWKKFQEDAKKNDLKPWLYNAGDANRVGPPDLGYYMGYKICQSFYEISTDKDAALRTIIAMKEPTGIIETSGYSQRFH
ncbi:MAG TPA: DUF2268 domain-containing putative Zn-dependent protease [Verrucomicrobiae bacterium]|nr:DUF2268 domain-containing putative Zn-dependent protease [Verrucomicrobiae bacterium]